MTTTPSDVTINGSIHSYLALTYANYLVVPRTLAQSMPAEWQERMVACLEELREAFAHVPQAEAYDVRPAVESTYDELTPTQRRQLDISYAAGSTDAAPLYFNAYDITTHFGHDRVLAWADRDPVPHYNRGRTYVEPHIPAPSLGPGGDIVRAAVAEVGGRGPETFLPPDRPQGAVSPGDPDWVAGFGPVPGSGATT